MTGEEDTERLQLALEQYLEQLERGELPDRERILANFPDIREGLAAHFDGLDALMELLPASAAARLEHQEQPELASPERSRLGDYELIRQIGHGGMGIVYEASQLPMNKRVALKVLPLDSAFDPNSIRRFEVEAEAAARLRHPHIVPIIDVANVDGVHFFAMQLIDGSSLALLLNDPLSIANRLSVGEISMKCSSLANALQHAHDQGVIHRDMKPGNLLLDSNGKLWLTDFGLARIRESQALTRFGELIGTLAYMSPEQRNGSRVDERSDIYSLGMTLKTWVEAAEIASTHDTATTNAPKDLLAILGVATHPEPSHRYQTARQFADDLERFAHGQTVIARTLQRRQQVLGRVRRYGTKLAVTITIAALLGLIVWTVRRAEYRNQLARNQAAKQLLRIDEMKYADGIQQAFAVVKSRPDQARSILSRYVPQPGDRDLRGFEWHLLDHLSCPPPLQTLGTHEGAANELAVLPGGRIASVGDDGKLKVWHPNSPRQNWSVDASQEAIFSVAASPDGHTIAIGNQTVQLWDADLHKFRSELTWHKSNVESIAFSPCGEKIATAARYEEVRLFDTAGNLLREVESSARHESIRFSVDGTRLLIPNRRISRTGGKLGVIQVWDGNLSQVLSEFLPANLDCGNYTLATSSHDGLYYFLAEQYDTQRMSLNSAVTGEELLLLPCHEDQVKTIAVSQDDLQVAAGFSDGSISVWNIMRDQENKLKTQPPRTILAHRGETNSLLFLGRDHLVSCGADGKVVLSQLEKTDIPATHSFQSSVYLPIVATNDVVVAATDQRLYVFSRAMRVIVEVDLLGIRAVDLSANGELVAVAAEGPSRIETRSTESGKLIETTEFDAAIRGIAFGQSDTELIVLTSDGQLNFLKSKTLDITHRLALNPHTDFPHGRLILSPDQKFLAVALEKNGLYLIDTQERRLVCFQSNVHAIGDMVFYDSGKRLATGHSDSAIRLRELPSLAETGQLLSHQAGGIQSLALSQDGRTLASSGRDGTVRLWSVPTGTCFGIVDRLPRPPLAGMFRRVALARDRLFVTSSHPPQLSCYHLK